MLRGGGQGAAPALPKGWATAPQLLRSGRPGPGWGQAGGTGAWGSDAPGGHGGGPHGARTLFACKGPRRELRPAEPPPTPGCLAVPALGALGSLPRPLGSRCRRQLAGGGKEYVEGDRSLLFHSRFRRPVARGYGSAPGGAPYCLPAQRPGRAWPPPGACGVWQRFYTSLLLEKLSLPARLQR